MKEEFSAEMVHLSDYLNVLFKRKNTILAVVAIAFIIGTFAMFTKVPMYNAQARLVVDKEKNASPLTGQRLDYQSYADQQLTFNTHFVLIKSKPVIMRVIEELRLDEPRAGSEKNLAVPLLVKLKSNVSRNIQLLKDFVKSLLGEEKRVVTEDVKRDSLVESIQSMIYVGQIPDTRLVKISVLDTDPSRAAILANSVARNYVTFDMESRLSASKDSLEWMNNEMYSLKKRVEDDEKKFYEYKQLHKLFSMEGKKKVVVQKIQEFNNEYLQARNKRLELDAKLDQIASLTKGSEKDIGHLRSVINNATIDSIYKNLTELELERTRLSKVFKAKHPKMIRNSGEIEKNHLKIKSELNKEIDNLKTERSIMLAKEKVMEQSIAEFEKDALEESGKELKYTMLQRNLETSQSLYDTLVSRVKESDIASSGASSNIRIVENAVAPLYPIGSKRTKVLVMAVLFGVLAGIAVAFFLEYVDQSLTKEEDVANYLGLPVLSLIPKADSLVKK